ncbi:type II toxin-antitoxin system VapC family toxin [Massilia sp. PAMC28688]|uniref:type II toxin-antitoxin system tRNA(fMet)-specific endonuclease VapC n=1 Tax=Massilia sp. PAMC28688 TaxID=2861283 RepID=UPI001C62748A|nr:type II toxin-antitoxin system VapC family toxin [Massilia sp. PAMC28688]QYF91962.1 type II toxin-antitoxin system VapC family toxin [Massilia sp. PAMC28688]
MLDTNILIYLIKQKPAQVMRRFSTHALTDISVSSISVAELEFGVTKSGSTRNQEALHGWLQLLHRPAFDDHAAHTYGLLRTALEANGTPIGPLDTLIAAHAMALDMTLVTNNVREFSRVPGLLIEDWTKA